MLLTKGSQQLLSLSRSVVPLFTPLLALQYNSKEECFHAQVGEIHLGGDAFVRHKAPARVLLVSDAAPGHPGVVAGFAKSCIEEQGTSGELLPLGTF